jgi:hypothetical protein
MIELVRYLHLNPVRAGLAHAVSGYVWSSHSRYLAGRDGGEVTVEAVLHHFGSTRARAVARYREFVEAGVPQGHREDFYTLADGKFLGDERFVEAMERKGRQREKKAPMDIPIESIASRVARALGMNESLIRGRGRTRAAARARAVAAYVAREEAGISLREAARYFNRDDATLSLAVRRLERSLAGDSQLRVQLTHLGRVVRRGERRKVIKQISKA